LFDLFVFAQLNTLITFRPQTKRFLD